MNITFSHLIQAAVVSILPISELRGGIPFAFAMGANIMVAFLVCTAANLLVAPIMFLFLETIHIFLMRWRWYVRICEPFLTKAHRQVHAHFEKWSYLGLVIFVAIPLPLTGAYTGAIGAWALRLDKKKSILYISLGVIIAGIIVSLVSYLGIGALI